MNKYLQFKERIEQEVSITNEVDLAGLTTKLSLNSSLKSIRQALGEYQQVDATSTKVVGLAVAGVYSHAVQRLIDETVPISQNMFYWDRVLESEGRLLWHGVVQLPQMVRDWHWRFNLPSPQPSRLLYLINTPSRKLHQDIRAKRQRLLEYRNQLAERLGLLVNEALNNNNNNQSLTESVAESASVLSRVMGVADSSSHDGDVTSQLMQVIDSFDSDQQHTTQMLQHDGKPGVIRFWPFAVVGAVVGLKVLGNWRAIVYWLRHSVVDTLTSLWQNWILEPMYKIYQTVRHDDEAQIALMTKQSLQADMKSLERMVVDFAKDVSGVENAESVRQAVSQGDLSAVLEPYEKQLQSPITSLIKGGLVRSLLIQVQKTKVDVEVAMDGIDKMLQSQQLVFGLVAALPAIGVVGYSISKAKTYVRGEHRHKRDVQELKDEACICLGQVTDILNGQEVEGDLSHQSLGLILCQTAMLRQLGKQFMSMKRYEQWCTQLMDLEETPCKVDQIVKKVDRLWVVYGSLLNS